jgi:hypothetical protein
LIENGHGNTWFDPEAFNGKGGVRPSFTEAHIHELSLLPGVNGVMSLGSVLSVELSNATVDAAPSRVADNDHVIHENTTTLNPVESSTSNTSPSTSPPTSLPTSPAPSSSKNARYYNSSASAIVVSLLKRNGVYARPLGNVVYLMPTPLTPEADRENLVQVLKRLVLYL